MGYGKAEALLYFKHPYRFNMLGQSRWLGRIYGEFTTPVCSRAGPSSTSAPSGAGLFQTLYEAPSSLLRYLPFTLEWNAVGILLLCLARSSSGRYMLPLASSRSRSRSPRRSERRPGIARIDPAFRRLRAPLLIALLTYLGPLVRGLQRYRWRLRGLADVEPVRFAEPRQRPRIGWFASEFRAALLERARRTRRKALLGRVMEFLIPRKYLIDVDPGWNDWDLEIHRGIWAQARRSRSPSRTTAAPSGCCNVRCRPAPDARRASSTLGVFALLVVAGRYLSVPEVIGVGDRARRDQPGRRSSPRTFASDASCITSWTSSPRPVHLVPRRRSARRARPRRAGTAGAPLVAQVCTTCGRTGWRSRCALVQVLLIGVLELLKPWPLKIVVDNVLGEQPLPFGLAAGGRTQARAARGLRSSLGLPATGVLGVLSVFEQCDHDQRRAAHGERLPQRALRAPAAPVAGVPQPAGRSAICSTASPPTPSRSRRSP